MVTHGEEEREDGPKDEHEQLGLGEPARLVRAVAVAQGRHLGQDMDCGLK